MGGTYVQPHLEPTFSASFFCQIPSSPALKLSDILVLLKISALLTEGLYSCHNNWKLTQGRLISLTVRIASLT